MNDSREILERLVEMVKSANLGEPPPNVPLPVWLDSLGRLELVLMIEQKWNLDLEDRLLGDRARTSTLAHIAAAIDGQLDRGI